MKIKVDGTKYVPMKNRQLLPTEDERLNFMPIKRSGTEYFPIDIVDYRTVGQEIYNYRKENNLSMQISIKVKRQTFAPTLGSEKVTKQISKRFKVEKDPYTGVHYGIPIGDYTDGNLKYQMLEFKNVTNFNLELARDRDIWAIARMSPYLEDNSISNASSVEFLLEDKEIDSQKTINSGNALVLALNRFIDKVKGEDILSMARYLGVGVSLGDNNTIISANIIEEIKNDPIGFNKKWDDPERKLKSLYYSAVAARVIEEKEGYGIVFNNLPLGFSDEEAINTIKENVEISVGIRNMMKEKDTVGNEISKTRAIADTKLKEVKPLDLGTLEESKPELILADDGPVKVDNRPPQFQKGYKKKDK